MKNSKLFPYERNKYYYGKLLSVDDFELEQKYVNDKRRTANRFLYGTGVVAGMYVLQVDDFTVSVERGLALDYSGREIVIDNPVIKKLSLMEGYEGYEESRRSQGYMYLCLEYDEEDQEPVYNVAGRDASAGGEQEFNKIKEGYRLFLTDNEPENDTLSTEELYRDVKTVYWGNGIRIKQSLPRFVRSGCPLDLKIEVENMGQQKLFAFSYDLQLTCLSYEGKSSLKVSFNEALYEKSSRYQLSYELKAHDVVNTDGCVTLEEAGFLLSLEQKQVEAQADCKQHTAITAGDEKQELIHYYYRSNMETILRNNFQQSIYLAKIYLIRAGDSCIIEKIENVPFHQYVTNNVLSSAVSQLMMKDVEKLQKGNLLSGTRGETKKDGESRQGDIRYAQGEVTIRLGDRMIKGKRFLSDEVVHGLGVGQAAITLSLITEEGDEIYGDSGVFDDTDPEVILAAKLYRDKGSFVIGVLAVSESMKQSVRVHWTALKDAEEIIEERAEQKIFIKPNVLNLKMRESYYLEAVCANMKDKRLKWSVQDHCGTVDENGMYTAPNESGVFEVTAQSLAYPGVRASIFVIVREPEGE